MISCIKDHYLSEAQQVPSPNHNQRPTDVTASLLVIHNISLPPGQFGSNDVVDFFQNKLDCSKHPFYAEIAKLTVAAHLFINRVGACYQFVPFNKRAWHAGVSSFDGVDNCNDYSIGIELEGTDDLPYTDAQYATLSQITQLLQQTYPAIVNQRITGHSDVAPGRKTDPGPAFDWPRFRSGLSALND